MKRCLIIGGAASVWDDANAACELSEFEGVIAAKRIGEVWSGPLDAWVTLHPNTFGASVAARAQRGYDMRFDSYACVGGDNEGEEPFRFTARISDWAGSSGLLAVRVALMRGYDRIVLAGVPMDESAHFDRATPWAFPHSYRKGWRQQDSVIAPSVRSMSGWTKTFLGAPKADWLNG